MNDRTILAVIVLYKQPYLNCETYLTLLQYWENPIYIYDNSPRPQEIKLRANERYVHDASNPGVSAAYNKAASFAALKKHTHLLLLDSDSSFPSNSSSRLKLKVQEHPEKMLLPTLTSAGRKVSPFYFYHGKSRYGDSISTGPILSEKILAINSGTMLPLNLFLENGGFNESLPLDWSDVDFQKRLKKLKPDILHIDLTIKHRLSEHEVASIASTRQRFNFYLNGIAEVADGGAEKLKMFFWAFLKSIKLSVKFKSACFVFSYFKALK